MTFNRTPRVCAEMEIFLGVRKLSIGGVFPYTGCPVHSGSMEITSRGGVPRIKSNSSCTLLDALTDNETESCNIGEKSVTSCVHGNPVPRFKTLPSPLVPNGEMYRNIS